MAITAGTKRPDNSSDEKKESDPEAKRLKVAVKDNHKNGDDGFFSGYAGFSFQDTTVPLKVDVVSRDHACVASGPQAFFDAYISKRKPCVLDFLPTVNNNGSKDTVVDISKALLEQVAGDKIIQVERRLNFEENFGQNRTASRQVLLTISDFLQKITSQDGALYYWSTQEDTIDPYNVPCRQLVDAGHIPNGLGFLAGNLILSSCNLWMGKTKTSSSKEDEEGASSGLHHDYHDNFYLLLRGRKRFRLLSPDCAPNCAVYGTIDKIHPNGRVSYVGNEARADGVPLSSLEEEQPEADDDDDDEEEEIVLGKGFDYVSEDDDDEGFDANNDKDDFDEIMEGEANSNNDTKERVPLSSLEEDQPEAEIDNDDEEEEEIVLGKGFDYVSEDEEDKGFDANNDKDDFEDMMENENENDDNNDTKESEKEKAKGTDANDDERPDSFSPINPGLDKSVLEKEYPSFASCRQVTVELKAGQMLYLPAGWFHEVTSYSCGSASGGKDQEDPLGDCHMALNYWFHPPDALNNYSSPYQDDFWKKEEQQRLQKGKKE